MNRTLSTTNGQTDVTLELSVDETNKLRKELGLASLRLGENFANSEVRTSGGASTKNNEATVVLALTKTMSTPGEDGGAVLEMSVDETNRLRASLGLAPLRSSSKKEPQHVNPADSAAAQAAKERLELAQLKRTVERGYRKFDPTLAAEPATAASTWAEQMLRKGENGNNPHNAKEPMEDKQPDEARKRKKKAKRTKQEIGSLAVAYDESDLNGLTVAHSLKEFGEDSTTILTLQDALLVDTARKELNEAEVPLENVNLAEAHKVAHGLREKRKVEMGMGRTNGYAGFDDDEFEELGGTQGPSRMARGQITEGETMNVKVKGFRIGSTDIIASDNNNDAEDTRNNGTNSLFTNKPISLESTAVVTAADFMTTEEDEQMRQKKNDKKFKKSKKDKKRKKRSRTLDEDSDDDQLPKPSLLETLEETAVEPKKKDSPVVATTSIVSSTDPRTKPSVSDRRDRYNMIMAKGNQRAAKAFDLEPSSQHSSYNIDEEPDDAFLNAALERARRLKRLQDMQRGALAVTNSLKTYSSMVPELPSSSSKDVQVFETDETSEFTRALRARSAQSSRTTVKQKSEVPDKLVSRKAMVDDVEMKDALDSEVDLHELSKDIKDDILPTSSAQLGRGVGSVLEMLKGELSQKNAGKEVLRGRAKDERTYEDYEPLNLGEVVRIDERNASKVDRELAKREIKLEYRDKHGRLLTRKEAYRELCYKFHGHGSGKRKEEKKLQQIAREQAEARLVQESATMGALQATQKATGKAFVIHKAGKR